MSIRDDKIASLLTHLAGAYIAREAGRETLITPTHVSLSKDQKTATIFVSVFPVEKKDNALSFLTRNKDEFRNYLKKESRLSRLPFIRFEIDLGEEHRQQFEKVLKDAQHNA